MLHTHQTMQPGRGFPSFVSRAKLTLQALICCSSNDGINGSAHAGRERRASRRSFFKVDSEDVSLTNKVSSALTSGKTLSRRTDACSNYLTTATRQQPRHTQHQQVMQATQITGSSTFFSEGRGEGGLCRKQVRENEEVREGGTRL